MPDISPQTSNLKSLTTDDTVLVILHELYLCMCVCACVCAGGGDIFLNIKGNISDSNLKMKSIILGWWCIYFKAKLDNKCFITFE